VLALVGVAELVDDPLRVDAFDDVLIAMSDLDGSVEEEAIATNALPNVNGIGAARVEGGIHGAAGFDQDLSFSLDTIRRDGLGRRFAGAASDAGG